MSAFSTTPRPRTRSSDEFRSGLRELGRVEGQTLSITYRSADGQLDRLPALADRIGPASNVDVIIALGPCIVGCKTCDKHDPHRHGVQRRSGGKRHRLDLARPGGNITGFSYMSTDLAANASKCCAAHFLKARASVSSSIRVNRRTELEMRETEAAARTIGRSAPAAGNARS